MTYKDGHKETTTNVNNVFDNAKQLTSVYVNSMRDYADVRDFY